MPEIASQLRPPLLAEALDLAAGCRAGPIAERARAELRAAGGRRRRDRRRGVEALTPSELRVARMAADGQTNRQIAHGLYLTTKTVETHLAHAYAKLGISNRGQQVNALRIAQDFGALPDANATTRRAQFGHRHGRDRT